MDTSTAPVAPRPLRLRLLALRREIARLAREGRTYPALATQRRAQIAALAAQLDVLRAQEVN